MDEKTWAKWSAIAEITSSIAILVTLVYLAIQTRQNTDAILSQSRQNLSEGVVNTIPMWMEYPELTEFIIDNTLEMSMQNKVQLDNLMILSLARREFAWHQFQDGLLDEVSWQTERNVMAMLVGTPRLRSWWENVGRYGRDPGFVAEVDKLLSDDMHPYWVALKNW